MGVQNDDELKELDLARQDWEYFLSIHADLAKYPAMKYKWVVISEKKCIDIFSNYNEAIELGPHRFAGKPISIIKFDEDVKKCMVADLHVLEGKKEDWSADFGPFKPTTMEMGYGHWIANPKKGKESYPVKDITFANMFQPIIKPIFDRKDRENLKWVSLRLVQGDDKTYIGLYIGDIAQYKHLQYDEKEQKLFISESEFSTHPIFYIPALNKCVGGVECWWQPTNDPSKIDGITDDDIKNWGKFVSGMLKAMDAVFEKREKAS